MVCILSPDLISKQDWSGIFLSVRKCLQGYLRYPVEQSLCGMLLLFKEKGAEKIEAADIQTNTEGHMLWWAEILSH